MQILQDTIILNTPSRGYHLITEQINQIVPINKIKKGLLNLFLMHTSASLTINENADPSVREDFKNFEEYIIPRDFDYEHSSEGDDDMPAHIKSSLLGNSLTIPISSNKLVLGIWQGIYLCEHRDLGGNRKIFYSIMGN